MVCVSTNIPTCAGIQDAEKEESRKTREVFRVIAINTEKCEFSENQENSSLCTYRKKT